MTKADSMADFRNFVLTQMAGREPVAVQAVHLRGLGNSGHSNSAGLVRQTY